MMTLKTLDLSKMKPSGLTDLEGEIFDDKREETRAVKSQLRQQMYGMIYLSSRMETSHTR